MPIRSSDSNISSACCLLKDIRHPPSELFILPDNSPFVRVATGEMIVPRRKRRATTMGRRVSYDIAQNPHQICASAAGGQKGLFKAANPLGRSDIYCGALPGQILAYQNET